jgi:methyl-accepting chemotaxis protein
MGKLKVVTRLALGFGLILVFLLGISVLGMVGMSRINDALTDITAVNNAETKLVSALRNALSQRAIAIRNIALLDDQEGMRVESQTLARQERSMRMRWCAGQDVQYRSRHHRARKAVAGADQGR